MIGLKSLLQKQMDDVTETIVCRLILVMRRSALFRESDLLTRLPKKIMFFFGSLTVPDLVSFAASYFITASFCPFILLWEQTFLLFFNIQSTIKVAPILTNIR